MFWLWVMRLHCFTIEKRNPNINAWLNIFILSSFQITARVCLLFQLNYIYVLIEYYLKLSLTQGFILLLTLVLLISRLMLKVLFVGDSRESRPGEVRQLLQRLLQRDVLAPLPLNAWPSQLYCRLLECKHDCRKYVELSEIIKTIS